MELQNSTAIKVARDHIHAWSHHDWDKTKELLAPDIHAVVANTLPNRETADFTGIDNYMERKIKAAKLIKPGSVKEISVIGDEKNALIVITMRIGLGPDGSMVTLARACLYLLEVISKRNVIHT